MSKPVPVLVVGAGIAGIQAALDLGSQGIPVYLVDKNPSIGGKMAQLDKTFPTLDCASCILTPKMVAVSRNEKIKLLPYCEIQSVTGKAADFTVKVVRKPRYVDVDKCNGCAECTTKCPAKVPDEFNLNLNTRKAIYIPFPQAVPRKATIDAEHCWRLNPTEEQKERMQGRALCGICEKICPAKAIDFNQKPETFELRVSSIILSTGLELEDPRRVPEYGYGKYANVYTHLEFERLLSSTGPTTGHILRRYDNQEPKRIAFIQCVCSRDVRTNFYCSAFCCMASTRQAVLAKEHLPGVETTIFYMDIRAFGKGYFEFLIRAKEEFGVNYMRGRVAKISENPDTKALTLTYENTESGQLRKSEFDMVILAVGIKPSRLEPAIPIAVKVVKEAGTEGPLALQVEEDRFLKLENPYIDPVATTIPGIFVAGVAAGAKDIPDSVMQASAAAMKAAIISTGGGS